MGRASRWFRGLLGLKNITHCNQNQVQTQKKWNFGKSHKDKNHLKSPHNVIPGDDDARKHARAVAAATAKVAEAAVAAAQAAAAVVQLTSSGRRHISLACISAHEARAAVVIQSHFRAYLSRRALRALKALVKLQALVRGHLVRRQTVYTLQRLQTLVRAQARARAGRVLASELSHSSMKLSHFNHSGPATPEKFEQVRRTRSMKQDHLMILKRNGSNSSRSVNYDQGWFDSRRSCTRTDVETGNQHMRSLFHSSHLSLSFSTSKDSAARKSSSEVQSFIPPTSYSASTRSRGGSKRGIGGWWTPAKSDCSRSCVSVNSDNRSYMAGTESSRAKERCHSVPKQRPQIEMERSSSTKRCLLPAFDSQRGSLLHANNAYTGCGRLQGLN